MSVWASDGCVCVPLAALRQCSELSSDVWSVGCLLIELLTGRAPWCEDGEADRLSPLALMLHVGACDSAVPVLPSWVQVSSACRAFLGRCLVRCASGRASVEELLQDGWVQGCEA